MSTKADKFIAKHELERRQIERLAKHRKNIEQLSDNELERILAEPDEDELLNPQQEKI